jgi:hypothetical protein
LLIFVGVRVLDGSGGAGFLESKAMVAVVVMVMEEQRENYCDFI